VKTRLSTFCLLHSAFCLFLFLALSAHQLTLPGLHYDEAKEAGLNAMQLMAGQPVTAFRDATVGVGLWRLPLMVQDYIGALNVVLALPFLAVGGLNVAALRWLPICIAALTLIMTGKVARRLGGPVAAIVAVSLLAVNPTFIFWSRQGIFVTNLTALLFIASLWTGLRWWHDRRPADLWLTAFLWGLGLYAKLLFIWAIGALVIVVCAVWVAKRRQIRKSRITNYAIRNLLIAGGCFLLPLLPLLLFNLQTGGTLISIFSNLGQSYYGVNNRAYLPNLLARLDQLRTLLRGDHLWYLGEVYANQWAPWLAAASAITGCLLWVWSRRKDTVTVSLCHRVTLLPFALLVLIVAQSAFTVSDLFITHYALLVPLIPLGVGLIAAQLLSLIRDWAKNSLRIPTPRIRWFVYSAFCLLPSALLLTWIVTDLTNTLRYHRVLSVAGGYATHSDAIYRLTAFLQQREPSAPLALDWGVDAPVRFLSGGRVNPVEVFGYERLDRPDDGFAGRIGPFLANPDNLYVAHTREFTIFRGRAEALEQAAAAHGLRLEEAARFGERSGRPLFLVYRVIRP
jgi:hypothetical protein